VSNCIVKLDPDTISQRLIESVGMVTDLLQSNKQLRDSINAVNKEKENIENDNCILQSDNLELRDRIEILESIIKANANDYENYDWKKIIEEESDLAMSTFKSSNNKGVENVASVMVEVKKENRVLKRRIEHLELQISNLTNHFDYQGNIEPTRTLVNSQHNAYMQNSSNDFMSEQTPMTYYDKNSFPQANPNSSQNMRSTGFNRGRSKMNSKHSLRDNGRKMARRDMSLRNGVSTKGQNNKNIDYSMSYPSGPGMLDEPLPPAVPQGQGSYTNQSNMMVLNSNAPIKDKDEALKMLYSMMMNRVQKKRHTNF
jgi:hypothetical protein